MKVGRDLRKKIHGACPVNFTRALGQAAYGIGLPFQFTGNPISVGGLEILDQRISPLGRQDESCETLWRQMCWFKWSGKLGMKRV